MLFRSLLGGVEQHPSNDTGTKGLSPDSDRHTALDQPICLVSSLAKCGWWSLANRSRFLLAATLVLSGRLHVRVEKTGVETSAARIGEILNATVDRQEVRLADACRAVVYTLAPLLAITAAGLLLTGPQRRSLCWVATFSPAAYCRRFCQCSPA